MRLYARRIRERLSAEQGFALVLALAAMLVLGTAGTTVMIYTTANQNASTHQSNDQAALALAEAGLNFAVSRLEGAADPSSASAVPSTPAPEVTLQGGTATYTGSYDSTTKLWSLTGIGRVHNPQTPDNPATDIVRYAHMRAKVGTGTIGGANNASWNYIYSDDPNSCATLSNNTSVAVPVYVRGSLCLNNSAMINGGALQVGGRITVSNVQASVGTSTNPLTEIHVAGGCSTNGVTYDNPCGPADHVYGQTVNATLTPMSKPPVDLDSWYRNAMPGPMHGCTYGSFPGGFDNDGLMNRSLRQPVDLTPAKTSYDCRVYDASGNLVGRIAWTPGSPGVLTILGTIFFDGDIAMSQLVNAQYQGRATIYASGTISLQNQINLCPVGGCGPNWDPNTNLLAFVAGSSTDATGFSIGNNSMFEGAVYAVDDYQAGNNTTMWGPIIAHQIYMQNSTMNVFPPIMNLMSGMPHDSYTTVTTVSVVSGSWS